MEPEVAAIERPVTLQKGILKKTKEQLHRSASITVGEDSAGKVFGSGAATPKRRAIIRDGNGIFAPGEQDVSSAEDQKHCFQHSIADRTAGERVSYRLIQQRSMDCGLYSQLDKCALEQDASTSSPSLTEPITEDDSEESGSLAAATSLGDLGRLIYSQAPTEGNVMQLIQTKQGGQPFSLRDILAHRFQELPDDSDEERTSENPITESP